jgi:hypothetical protein
MRVSLAVRRPPNRLERMLGRRRARLLRRRLGLVALGTGVTLLRPRTRWTRVAIGAAFVVTLVVGLGIRP